MITGKLIVMSAAAFLSSSLLFAADDAMTPAADAPATHHHAKLTKPYSELSGLDDDQKAKIESIHGDYLDQEKALLAKEKSDIETVLTDDQKAELKTMEENAASNKKEKTAKKKDMNDTQGEPTTQPAQ